MYGVQVANLFWVREPPWGVEFLVLPTGPEVRWRLIHLTQNLSSDDSLRTPFCTWLPKIVLENVPNESLQAVAIFYFHFELSFPTNSIPSASFCSSSLQIQFHWWHLYFLTLLCLIFYICDSEPENSANELTPLPRKTHIHTEASRSLFLSNLPGRSDTG